MNQDSLPVLTGGPQTSTNLRQRQQQQQQPCSDSRTQANSSSSPPPLRNERQQGQRRIATTTTTPLGRPTTTRRRSKRKTLQEWVVALIKTSFYLGMNAAVTIFGLGVGVGLVLGDSLRASMTPQAAHDGSTDESLSSSSSSTTTWTLEPSCGGGATRRPRLVRQATATAVVGDSRPLASSSIPGGGLPAQ